MIKHKINFCSTALLLSMLVTGACNKKEETLPPSNKDENYLVVHDNPNDIVDHTIYELYKKTGVPVFYNDTLAGKQVGDSAGIPQYFYIKLMVTYNPITGETNSPRFTLLPHKQQVLPMLTLLENELLTVLPAVPSILLTDSLYIPFPGGMPVIRNAHVGFNTVAIRTVDTDTMSADARNQFTLSVLRTVAVDRLQRLASQKLTTDFYGVSNKLAPNLNAYHVSVKVLSPNGSKTLEDFGFITSVKENGVVFSPSELPDVESYVNAVFSNTTSAFNAQYANYPAVLKKFDVMKSMLTGLKFKLPG